VLPEAWPWAFGSVAANHAVLGAFGLWPRSTLLGPNLTRLPGPSAARREVAITFDDGPDREITPRILDRLDRRGARATFFCIAERAERHGALCREIVARGHSIENHSLRHRVTFPLLGLRGFREEICAAQDILVQVTGTRPRFFRAPAGLRNPMLDPVLHGLSLALVSWTRRAFDTRRSDPQRVVRELARGLSAGDILLLHDGQPARTPDGEAVSLAALPPLLDAIETAGLRTVTLSQAIAA
jgi:peptidoglycan/xylan/chitin deacetylase (PgdA/CDA1 family)